MPIVSGCSQSVCVQLDASQCWFGVRAWLVHHYKISEAFVLKALLFGDKMAIATEAARPMSAEEKKVIFASSLGTARSQVPRLHSGELLDADQGKANFDPKSSR